MSKHGHSKSLNLDYFPEDDLGEGFPRTIPWNARPRRNSRPDVRSVERHDEARHPFRAKISDESSSDLSDSGSDFGLTEIHMSPADDHMTMDSQTYTPVGPSTPRISPVGQKKHDLSSDNHLEKTGLSSGSKASQSLEMKTQDVIEPLDSPTAEYEDTPGSAHSSLTETRNLHSRSESTEVVLRSSVSRHDERHLGRWTRLMNLRSQALSTRSLMHEKRVELSDARKDVHEADEELMKLFRQINSSPSKNQNQKELDECFQKCQAARNTYGPLEDDYTALEQKLTREDYEIGRLERKLLKHLSGMDSVPREIEPAPCQDVEDDSDSESSSQSDDDESDAETTIPSHGEDPLYEEYLSRLGDADLCRESYNNLLEDRNLLLEAQAARNNPDVQDRLGKDLLPEDQEFLDNFPREKERILSELRRIEEDVEKLRVQCISKGLLGDIDTMEDEEGEEDLEAWFDRTPDVEQSQYHKFQLLQYQPEENEEEDRKLLDGPRIMSTGDRIIDWLMHKLRSSSHEVELLFRLSADELEPLPLSDIQSWQIGVLKVWYHDSSILPASAYESRHTLTITVAYSAPSANRGKEPTNTVIRHGKKHHLLPLQRYLQGNLQGDRSSLDGTAGSGRIQFSWKTPLKKAKSV